VRLESIETESQRDDLDIVRPLDHETTIRVPDPAVLGS
jgi:hypothetical protein